MQEPASHPSLAQTLAGLPGPILEVVGTLAEAGYEAYLVGGCVRDLALGIPVRDFDIATSAPPQAVLERFPRAVPIGLRHGTVMIPTQAGPVDVTRFRAGPGIEDDLAHRDFTMNALAADPRSGRLLDPHGGLADLAAGHLRAVGSAEARFAEDPLRALRGVRLAVAHALDIDAECEAAMRGTRAALRRVPRERVRHELERILLAPEAARGIRLLRRLGLEADLLPGAPPDADRVVAALPPDLPLRLAAWLRGTDANSILRRLRFPRRTVQQAALLVRLHPVDRAREPRGLAATRRLVKRAGMENIDALIALREAEIGVAAAADGAELRAVRETLDAIRAAVTRIRADRSIALHRLDLAMDGRAVMQALDCGPGPVVGRALRHLTDRVVEDPSQNTPERLRVLLLEWAGKTADAPSDASPPRPKAPGA
jgi:tRNA nucleotidyltransferase (CCA-adding enzyme)